MRTPSCRCPYNKCDNFFFLITFNCISPTVQCQRTGTHLTCITCIVRIVQSFLFHGRENCTTGSENFKERGKRNVKRQLNEQIKCLKIQRIEYLVSFARLLQFYWICVIQSSGDSTLIGFLSFHWCWSINRYRESCQSLTANNSKRWKWKWNWRAGTACYLRKALSVKGNRHFVQSMNSVDNIMNESALTREHRRSDCIQFDRGMA